MATVLGANTLSTGGFQVDNSIRFNGSNSVMQRNAAGTPSSTKIWSISFWAKRCRLGTTEIVWMHQNAANHTAKFQISFHNTDTCRIETYDGTSEYNLSTDMRFRDTSAWYSILVNVDSTQGTEANRYKIFVNGIQAAVTETGGGYPAQNWDLDLGSQKIALGRYQAQSPSGYYDGYVAEVVYADGQTLAPTDIGEFDSDSGIFKPIDVSELTLGNAGFYINFSDSSDLGAATGNDFALTNLAAVDQSLDTCTNNFATMNPLDNFYAGHAFAEGSTKISTTTSTTSFNTATIGLSTGKWYFEGTVRAVMGEENIGISPVISTAADDYAGKATDGIIYKGNNGAYRKGDSATSYGDAYANNNVIGCMINLDDNEIRWSKNGTIQNSGTAVSITAAASTPHGVYFPVVGDGSTDTVGVWEVNFGAGSFTALSNAAETDSNGIGRFEYEPPSGFLAICTKNLAESG